MSEKDEKKQLKTLSRREFIKDAGIVVGGTAVGSAFILTACGESEEITKTVTKTNTTTATQTATVTTPGGTVTQTATETLNKFVCPYDGQEFDSLDALKAHLNAEHGGATATGLNIIELNVNGWAYQVQVEPNWTLAYVLRDKLGLTGTKIACDQGTCGSCTVIVDEEPCLSCMMLAIEAGGKEIKTIENLQKGSELDPLQNSFVVHDAMQCGYCTPGMIMSAKALLMREPSPSKEEIKKALSGNLCRCGAYTKIVEAIMEVA